jgi:ElaB/YqjD/DUF883 family membrane-anchored ribosome-binding protein
MLAARQGPIAGTCAGTAIDDGLLQKKKGRLMKATTLKTTRTDIRTLVKDAQELFREATTVTGEKADDLRNRGLQLLDSAMVKAQEVQTVALETGKELAEKTDDYVHENPWGAVAISAGVGLLLGMLISRK